MINNLTKIDLGYGNWAVGSGCVHGKVAIVFQPTPTPGNPGDPVPEHDYDRHLPRPGSIAITFSKPADLLRFMGNIVDAANLYGVNEE